MKVFVNFLDFYLNIFLELEAIFHRQEFAISVCTLDQPSQFI